MTDLVERLKAQLEVEEGYRRFPYLDALGVTTVGIGRNLDKTGISRAEARYLLENDIRSAITVITAVRPWFAGLSDARKAVLVDMAINMGVRGLMNFKKMLGALERGDILTAVDEMKDSNWWRKDDVVARWRKEALVKMMASGEWPDEGAGRSKEMP